ncbi:MAG: hypothetical protein KDK28_07945 [Maritimibacter sp.]|nr:hypothetical protein [Maritimibacter sp.]
MAGTSEHEIAVAVMRIAANHPKGIATFKKLYSEIPNEVALSATDWAPSTTRNGEPMWYQIVRNIQSHHDIEGNAIAEGWLNHVPRVGYEITKAGRARIGI